MVHVADCGTGSHNFLVLDLVKATVRATISVYNHALWCLLSTILEKVNCERLVEENHGKKKR